MYILLAFISTVIVWSVIHFKKAPVIPGPIPFPIIGNLNYVFLLNPRDVLSVLRSFKDTYGDSCLFHIFHLPYIVLFHPKYAEDLLTNTHYIKKGRSYQYLHPWLGDGLLTSTGHRWKTHRKLLTPAFHFNILQNFLQVFLKNEKILVKKLQAKSNGKPVNLFPIIALNTLDNVMESIMGVSVDAQLHLESEYVKSIETRSKIPSTTISPLSYDLLIIGQWRNSSILSKLKFAPIISSITAWKMRNPFMANRFIFNLTSYKKMQDKALKVIHDQTLYIIEKRKKELDSKNANIGDVDDIGIKNKHAFLDLLLLSKIDGEKINIQHVREDVDTFMFAGHDTTTSGIAFALYCISKSKEIQGKILEEQKQILGDLNRDPTYVELRQMKYLEMVIKESIRLYPPAPLIERMITKDTNISGLTVLKNTSIIVNIFEIQRRAEVFEEPLEFRPERFAAFNTTKNAFSWLAFSAGPRNCIGQKFAMMEMKVTIAGIVKNFKLLPVDEKPILLADIILKSENGILVAFNKRK